MKKTGFIILASAVSMITAGAATERLWLNNGNISMGLDVADLDSISIADNNLNVTLTNGETHSFDRTVLNTITAVEKDKTDEVLINFDGDNVSIVNPYAFKGCDITTNGADVVVNNTYNQEIVYHVTGTTTTGSLKVYSTIKLEVMLDNASITNDNGSAINIQTGKKTTIRVKDGTESSLCDSKKYNTPDGEDEKGTLFSEGQIEFRGKGTLNITGTKKHAICSDDYVELKNTNINILSASSDGIHANDYVSIVSGSLTADNLGGDAIDCDDEGYFAMEDGTITATITGDTNKGIKTKAGNITISGGSINLTMKGNSVIEDKDPSYCSGIKCGNDFTMTGGDITIRSTGTAGKGISVDGNGSITDGSFDIEVAGAGGTYTTTSNTTDSYSATCITVDGNLSILGGSFVLNTTSAASGGKCIKVDGDLTIGDDNGGPNIQASTNGSRFSVSGGNNGGWSWNAPGGGGGGGNWGGGGGATSNYSNPKVIKAVGILTVNNGTFKLTGKNEGAECLESKNKMIINGGTIEATSYDDCINASSETSSVKPDLTINGGKIYCTSSNNDAIDSNGTIHINGGLIIALGSTSPECGIDCDSNSNFVLTGGTLVSLAGSNNTPGGSGTTQRVVTTTGSFNTSTEYTFTDADGNFLLSFKSPRAYSGNANLMVSAPYMTKTSLTVKEYTGATLSGGELFNGVTLGATYTGGTLKTSLKTK